MLNRKEVTIYDLAKQLNISATTVSRALSNHPAISKKTSKKISDLAREMGYQQNTFASSLRKQKTHTIGVIVHELNSHFIISVLSGIERMTTQANYNIIIGHSAEASSKEAANVMNLFHKRVDGLIASLAYDTKDLQHYDAYLKKGIPIVFFDRVKETGTGIKVIINNEKAGYNATEHLIKEGCKTIAHITGNTTQNVYANRLKGFENAMKDNNLAYDQEQIIITDLSEKGSIEAARQVLKMEVRPDGIFIANDLCAAICMQVLKDAGLRVPEDIAIVGFNNDTISRIVEPKLTTVNYNGREMGEVAAKCLIDQMKGGSSVDSTYTIILESELIVRGSSLKKSKASSKKF